MKFIISGKNIEITRTLKDRVIKKISKLEKFFDPGSEAQITMGVEKNRHILDVTILSGGTVARTDVSDVDMYACIDKALDKLEQQAKKNKSKWEKKNRDVSLKNNKLESDFVDNEEKAPLIIPSKKFSIKPKSVEDAIMQMDEEGLDFLAFSNFETNQFNVVYKRKDGNYGLVEPED